MSTDEQSTVDNRQSTIPEWLLVGFQQALGHDLPNQLVAAQGLLRLLDMEEGDRLSDEGRDYLRRLSAGADRSQALVGSLAELVRAVRGGEAAQPVVLAELVQEVAAEIKHSSAGRTIAFHFDILIATLTAPPREFRKVLVQLFRSALHLAADSAPRIEASAAPAPAGVKLRVAGNGALLTAEQQQRLFEPFAGGAAGADHRLGLLLARTLVDRWGGDLGIQSGPGQGSAFVVWLPQRE